MKVIHARFTAECSAVAVAITATTVAVLAARQVYDVEAHLVAAQTAAGEHHTRLFEYLCALEPTVESAAPPAAARMPEWHAAPAKVFDNLYFLGTRSLNSWAVTTSGGIIVIAPLYDRHVQGAVIDGLTTLGLDPTDISHVLVSHGHSDHYGGARRLQQAYGATVLLSAADWDLVLANDRPEPKPERDQAVVDGQRLTVGDTSLTLTLTPGHTPGTISTLIPVRDGGRSHVAAIWGGTAMRPTAAFYAEYAASARKFADAASVGGADVVISNHDIFDDAHRKIAALAERGPDDPHPFVIGADATMKYLDVVQHCAAAGLARLEAGQ